ncbi:hypothetical protein N7532_006336 [Penicillium argentinense]|uniref:Uncharacterized protein n=1 Tax=Penicillium argentinense TaxID=1131581 RepID=A0A9W9FFL4_9EURO|nr:uncharacterized protein N7532_006336 [Penicillium argentinense]KAJ5099335.1 hypothetical protein N7532_006336 [Penicillium argentinense]
METTAHQGSFPDRSEAKDQPVSAGAVENTPFSNQSHDRQSSDGEDRESTWKPRFDRRQSWSNEDRKHQLQERLLNVEGSRERGFSETDHFA